MGLVDAWPTPRRLEGQNMTLSRWETAIHEGAHCVAAIVLLNDRQVGAALIPTRGGICYAAIPTAPACWSEVIAVAAGAVAAEVLAENERPPQFDSDNNQTALPTSVADRSGSSFYQELREDLEATIDDEVIVARWCVEGFANRPHRWAERHAELMDRTKAFVEAHKGCILLAAQELYLHGVIVLRTSPPNNMEGERGRDSAGPTEGMRVDTVHTNTPNCSKVG